MGKMNFQVIFYSFSFLSGLILLKQTCVKICVSFRVYEQKLHEFLFIGQGWLWSWQYGFSNTEDQQVSAVKALTCRFKPYLTNTVPCFCLVVRT